jgi:hypothetical protein
MATDLITLHRDFESDSTMAADILNKLAVHFVQSFTEDQSEKPSLLLSGYPDGLIGLEGVKYFVEQTDATLADLDAISAKFSMDPTLTAMDQLDQVLDIIETRLSEGKLAEVSMLLNRFVVTGKPVPVLLMMLTGTLPEKSGLVSRIDFVKRVRQELLRIGKDENQLLKGLA